MTAPLIPTPSDWIDNTGTVPDGVEAGTVIEVEYRKGLRVVWRDDGRPANLPDLWTLVGHSLDVIRWRKVQP